MFGGVLCFPGPEENWFFPTVVLPASKDAHSIPNPRGPLDKVVKFSNEFQNVVTNCKYLILNGVKEQKMLKMCAANALKHYETVENQTRKLML